MAKDADTTVADEVEPAPAEVPAAAPRSRKRLLLIGAGTLAVLAAGGAAAWWALSGDSATAVTADAEQAEPEAEPAPEAAVPEISKAPPQYLALTPSFVVNVADEEALRYLQVDIEVMARDSATIDAVKLHMPVIRNDLLLLMGQQRFAELDTREGKEKLQAAALAEIQRILTEQTGEPGVEAVYFTSFVTQ